VLTNCRADPNSNRVIDIAEKEYDAFDIPVNNTKFGDLKLYVRHDISTQFTENKADTQS
jgi:hypothetical protein